MNDEIARGSPELDLSRDLPGQIAGPANVVGDEDLEKISGFKYPGEVRMPRWMERGVAS